MSKTDYIAVMSEKRRRVPTKTEIHELFVRLGAVGDIRYAREKSDADGLTTYDILVPSETLSETTGYEYCRKGRRIGDLMVEKTIERVDYDELGVAYDDKLLAKMVNGEWVILP